MIDRHFAVPAVALLAALGCSSTPPPSGVPPQQSDEARLRSWVPPSAGAGTEDAEPAADGSTEVVDEGGPCIKARLPEGRYGLSQATHPVDLPDYLRTVWVRGGCLEPAALPKHAAGVGAIRVERQPESLTIVEDSGQRCLEGTFATFTPRGPSIRARIEFRSRCGADDYLIADGLVELMSSSGGP